MTEAFKKTFEEFEGFLPIVVTVYGWQTHGVAIGLIVGAVHFVLDIGMHFLLDLRILFNADRFSNPRAAMRVTKWILFFLFVAGIALTGREADWAS